MSQEKRRIAVIGLGYVGLPLAVEFGKILPVVGFDINQKRVGELKAGLDCTLETELDELKLAIYLKFSDQKADLNKCTIFIISNTRRSSATIDIA